MPTWSPSFETGHAEVDAEHREYFRQLDLIADAVAKGGGREEITALIITLQTYVLGHFSREEAHMQRVGCPAQAANASAHREFSRQVEDWLNLLTLGNAPMSLMLDIHRQSTAWIQAHITNVDCRLRTCARR